MDSPTSQSVASYLSNHMGFQSWLAQHANQDIASLHNDPELSKFREEYNQNLNLGKLRTDPAQNTNIDINTFMQGVEMAKNMGNQVTAQNKLTDLEHWSDFKNTEDLMNEVLNRGDKVTYNDKYLRSFPQGRDRIGVVLAAYGPIAMISWSDDPNNKYEIHKSNLRRAQMVTKQMDHNAYPESLKTKSDNELRYIMKDAYEAMKANPENPNNGYYQDEINYCANELSRRQRGVKAQLDKPADPNRDIKIKLLYDDFWLKIDNKYPPSLTIWKGNPEYGNTIPVGYVDNQNDSVIVNKSFVSEWEKLQNSIYPQDTEEDVEYVGANKKQAQQTSNFNQLVSNVNKSLITAQNSLVDLVELLNQGLGAEEGIPVDRNVSVNQDEGPTGQFEHLRQVVNEMLPQIEQAAQVFQSEMKYFSSFSAPQQMSVGGPVISKKVSVATKYITGIKSLQEAHDKVEQVYQFANNFPYFVLNYDGFKVLCNFKTACNNLKKDIEILQKN